MLAEPRSPEAGPAKQSEAACSDGSGGLVDLFYSEEIADIVRAKQICSTCPVRIPCLEGATERREPYGVWGGQLFLRGKVLAFKRPRGRPPKNAPAPMIA